MIGRILRKKIWHQARTGASKFFWISRTTTLKFFFGINRATAL
jgi:hypothetical protein